MIEPLTPVVELHSRLGRVGSIQAWNPWDSRKSPAHAMHWIAKIASISFGNDAPKRGAKDVFQDLIKKGHMAVLEHVPFPGHYGTGAPFSLPAGSLRHNLHALDNPSQWGYAWAEGGNRDDPASTFLVEVPLYTRSQWHRHRSQAYNEMSRRWTKDSKVGFTFYGEQWLNEDGTHADPERLEFWKMCLAEYQRRLDRGEPQETARGCVPMEAHTRFWASAYNRDWLGYLDLRAEKHAQEEIRVPATWIRNHIHPQPASIDAGNLGT